MSFNYNIEDCGRVKMAGGTFSTYYDLANALVGVENPDAEKIVSTHKEFKNLKNNPPFDLLLAFFPSESNEIKARLRGAGSYRHLRMDQGPGGNFARFDIGENSALNYNLVKDKGFAMPEFLVSEQLEKIGDAELGSLVAGIQKSFEKNDYKTTSILVNKFKTLSESKGVKFHNGEHVGSKSGFFFIRPTAAETDVKFPIAQMPLLKAKIDEALEKSLSLAEYARGYIKEGVSFGEAVIKAEKDFAEKGSTKYTEKGLLYFQPDCFVDSKGNIEVEKINMPDVGMFMTMFDRPSNPHLQRVVDANFELKDKLKSSAARFLHKDDIVLVTRDEVVNHKSDTLELLEIKVLRDMLGSIGKNVYVKTLAEYEGINKNSEVLLLNVDNKNKYYGRFAEHIIRNGITCYTDPLVYNFKDNATTLKTMEIPSKYMDDFMGVIKPKDITAGNSENIYNRLQYIMKRFDMKEDIVYANITGYKTPIPAFKYSLHSYGQIYNAYNKLNNKEAKIQLSSVPLNRDNAVFYGNGKPRMSAFRFMCTKDRD